MECAEFALIRGRLNLVAAVCAYIEFEFDVPYSTIFLLENIFVNLPILAQTVIFVGNFSHFVRCR